MIGQRQLLAAYGSARFQNLRQDCAPAQILVYGAGTALPDEGTCRTPLPLVFTMNMIIKVIQIVIRSIRGVTYPPREVLSNAFSLDIPW